MTGNICIHRLDRNNPGNYFLKIILIIRLKKEKAWVWVSTLGCSLCLWSCLTDKYWSSLTSLFVLLQVCCWAGWESEELRWSTSVSVSTSVWWRSSTLPCGELETQNYWCSTGVLLVFYWCLRGRFDLMTRQVLKTCQLWPRAGLRPVAASGHEQIKESSSTIWGLKTCSLNTSTRNCWWALCYS